MNFENILKAKKSIFTGNNENVKIDSIIVYDNGIKREHFYHTDELHELRSISKVLVALAYGVALTKKMKSPKLEKPIDLNTHVYPILQDLTQIRNKDNVDKMKKWTIWTLLTYSAGYGQQMFSESFIEKMDEHQYIDYVLNYSLENEPNEKYVYNNAEMFLLSLFFQEAFGENLTKFIEREIFRPLEIKEYVWNNYDGYCPGGTGLYLKNCDVYKIGLFILNKGKWGGRNLIKSEFINQMCSTQIETPYAVKPERVLPKFGVGYVMHISRDGWFYKDGTNGQYLIINFDKNIVISILSSEHDMKYVTEILRGEI